MFKPTTKATYVHLGYIPERLVLFDLEGVTPALGFKDSAHACRENSSATIVVRLTSSQIDYNNFTC